MPKRLGALEAVFERKVGARNMSPVLRLAARARRMLPDRWILGLYGHPHLAGLLRSTLNVFAPPGVQTVEVPAGPLRGVRLELNLKLEKYLWLGTYEPWVQEAIVRHLRPGDWAWDVGAYVGYHALLMWRLGANVVAFEPDPANFDRLSRNLEGKRRVWREDAPNGGGARSGLCAPLASRRAPVANTCGQRAGRRRIPRGLAGRHPA